jgi:hypothetical protein
MTRATKHVERTRLIPVVPPSGAHRDHKPSRLTQGVVVLALAGAIAAAGLGFAPHGELPKGDANQLGSGLSAPPPAAIAPAPVDVTPDTPMTDPPVLTPSLSHGRHARLSVPLQIDRVLAAASTTSPTVTAAQPQSAAAQLAPAQTSAPVQPTPQAAPVTSTAQVQTVQPPQTAWTTYPTYQPQYLPRASHHHGHHYDYDHDGDNH